MDPPCPSTSRARVPPYHNPETHIRIALTHVTDSTEQQASLSLLDALLGTRRKALGTEEVYDTLIVEGRRERHLPRALSRTTPTAIDE
jgi:hypothetical protein